MMRAAFYATRAAPCRMRMLMRRSLCRYAAFAVATTPAFT
jgi:hypothetical protein